jgi:hypothetical protein
LTKNADFTTLNLPMKKGANSHNKKIKRYTNKGALGAGTAYALLAMLIIMSAGSLMIGNIVPKEDAPVTGQTVILLSTTPEAEKNNLQLYTFPGATYTPTPSPTSLPQPQNEGNSNWSGGSGGGSGSGGSDNWGGGDGGSNSPDWGGGGSDWGGGYSGGGGGGGSSAVGAR